MIKIKLHKVNLIHDSFTQMVKEVFLCWMTPKLLWMKSKEIAVEHKVLSMVLL